MGPVCPFIGTSLVYGIYSVCIGFQIRDPNSRSVPQIVEKWGSLIYKAHAYMHRIVRCPVHGGSDSVKGY